MKPVVEGHRVKKGLCPTSTITTTTLPRLPLLPQSSAGQKVSTGCQCWFPVDGSKTQARVSQCDSEHLPQQQCSPMCSYLQSSASRLLQGLPGEARLHSALATLTYILLIRKLVTWCYCCPGNTPACARILRICCEQNSHSSTSRSDAWWLEEKGISLITRWDTTRLAHQSAPVAVNDLDMVTRANVNTTADINVEMCELHFYYFPTLNLEKFCF